MLDFNGQVVIVTGSGSPKGIGKTIALTFAGQGATVVVADMNSEGVKASVADIEAAGGKAFGITVDITSPESVQSMADTVMDRFGRIDVLVNNAGRSKIGLLMDMSVEEISDLINTNLMGAIYLSKLAVNNMLKNGGNIINISSVWGEAGASCEVVYSATKGGLNLFTKALAKEVASFNIRVNAVAPGVINTEMNNVFDSEEKEALKAEIPMMRFGEAHEVARVVSFLCDDKCKYLTGQIIRIDGGFI